MSGVKLILVILLWTIYGLGLMRALIQQRGDAQSRLAIWAMFFCACLAFTFTGQEVEEQVDLFFGGLPVSIYIKYFALTQGIHMYCVLLHRVDPLSNRALQALRTLNRVGLVLGISSFILIMFLDIRYQPDTRYYVSAARDAIVAIYMFTAIIPRTIAMFHIETVPTMRIKHLIYTLFSLTYVLVAGSSLISLFVLLIDLYPVDRLLPVFLPLTYVTYGFFICALLPHRWIAILLYPARLYTYLRLRRVRRDVQALTPVKVPLQPVSNQWLSLGGLEFAIYQTVIAILDYAPLLDHSTDDKHLASRLNDLLRRELTYPMIVKGLTRLRYDRPRA
jgi:hypothetical protein